MSSTTTKQDTINRTISLAMHAVAKYALEHRLPAPRAIRRPRLGDRAVRVDLFVGEHEEWVDAIGADYLSTTTIGVHARSVQVTWAGRVPSPIGEVAVELRIVQRVVDQEPVRPLSLVPGGAA
jgi:hypothetical protein